MIKTTIAILSLLVSINGFSQNAHIIDSLKAKKDSSLRATIHADSVKIEKEYVEIEYWEKLKAVSIYPVINAGEFSGVIPVKNITEVPDPTIDYKLLFELTANNPDSTLKDNNGGLVEVARVINLHAAAGIPLNKIKPVIVVHAGALFALCNNEYYKKHYKLDNPNLKLINDLEKFGASFIVCGQAMAFLKVNKEDLLPEIKISQTAQTVLSSYQLKGYVKYDLGGGK